MTVPISAQDLLKSTDTTVTPKPISATDLLGGEAQQQEQENPFDIVGNRLRNLWKAYKVSTGYGSPEEIVEVGNAMIAAEGSREGLFRSIGKDIVNTLAYYGKKPPEPGEPVPPTLMESLKGITAEGLAAGIPDVFTSIVSKPIESVTGVGLDRDTLYGMTPEERAQAIKDSAANIAMFAAGAGVGVKMSQATVKAGAKAIAASKGTEGALQAGRQFTGGAVKRAMIRGVAEGAAGGTAYAAISGLGDEDIGNQILINGVLFAPLGAAVEAVRFARPKSRFNMAQRTDAPGRVIAEMASDVAHARQLQITNKDSFADILYKLEGLETSDTIAEAIIRGRLKAQPGKPVVVPGVNGETLAKTMSALARGETKVQPQFYTRPDGLFDMLVSAKSLSPRAARMFRETGLVPNQIVEWDGRTYRFSGLSRDGQRVRLKNVDTGRTIVRMRSDIRVRPDLETHDVTSKNVNDLIWQDFRAFVLADSEGRPLPQPEAPNVKPTDPTPAPLPLVRTPSFLERVKTEIGRFIRDESGVLRMAGTDEELLYSRVEQSIENAPFPVSKDGQKKATGGQWKAHLAKNSPQFEREWLELDRVLEDSKDVVLTQDQVRTLTEANRIDISEVVYGGEQYQSLVEQINELREDINKFDKAMERKYGYYWESDATPEERDQLSAMRSAIRQREVALDQLNPEKHSGYKEEGGRAHRSIVLTLDRKRGKITAQQREEELLGTGKDRFQQSAHFEEYDVIGWARMQDYTLPNGEKVLYVEEIQSDWAQKMRDEGVLRGVDRERYKEVEEQAKAASTKFYDLKHEKRKLENKQNEIYNRTWSTGIDETQHKELDTLRKQVEELEKQMQEASILQRKLYQELYDMEHRRGVPDFPFKNTDDWVNLILKRIFAEAAYGGYDRIAFSSPMHQFLRWGSDKLEWTSAGPEGKFLVTGDNVRENPNLTLFGQTYVQEVVGSLDELIEVIDRNAWLYNSNPEKLKRVAEKMWNAMQTQKEGSILPRMEGMEGFYGKILPKNVKNLLKKLGAKNEIEDIRIPQFAGKEALAQFDNQAVVGPANLDEMIDEHFRIPSPLTVKSVRVPQELRETIKKKKQPLGSAQPAMVAGLAGAGIGGTAGLFIGNTPEERERNALIGAFAGAAITAGGVARLSRPRPTPAPPPIISPMMEAAPRSQFADLLDRFADQRGYSQAERAVLEREITQRFFDETMRSLPPEEQAVINALNAEIEQSVLRPGGSRLEQAQMAQKIASEEVIRKASSNGMYVDEEAAGNFVLRDAASGRIVGRFKNTTDAIEFINKSGQADGVDLDGGSGGVIPPRIASGLMPDDGGPPPFGDVPYAARPNDAIGNLNDLVNTVMDWATPNRNILTSLDSKFGTQFFARVYDTLQVARMKANAAIRPWYEKLKKIDEIAVKLSKPEREDVSAYLETASPDEIKAGGGLGGRPLNPNEIALAEQFAAHNIDLLKVQKYLKELGKLEREVQRGRIDQATADQLGQDAARGFGLDANHLAAAQAVSQLREVRNGYLGPIARLTNAILNQDVSRADFARARRMNGRQLRAAAEMENLYRELAGAFNIPDSYKLQDLMAYARQYTEGDLGAALRDFDVPPAVKEFYSALQRTGELSSYEKDPVRSLQRYIKAGFDSRIMSPAVSAAKKAIPEELAKLPDEARGKAKHVVERYMHDVQGIPSEAPKFTQAAVNHFLDKLGLRVPVNVREDVVNLVLATGEAAMQGFRIHAGIRDLYQGVAWYYGRFGLARTMRLLEYGTKGLDGLTKANLQSAGIIPELDVLFFTTPTEFTGTTLGRASNVVGRTLRKVSHAGLKMSGQKDVYAMLHAGAYLDTWKKAGDELTKVARGETTREKAYKKLLIDTYELPTIKAFDDLVRNNKIDDAAKLLARETAREQVGVFGSGNNPGGWNRNIGRIAGQYGTWSMWYRAQLGRALSRGSYGNRAATFLRYGATQAAIAGASTALGVSLANWYAPTGVLFTGGPLTDVAVTVAEAMRATGYTQEVALNRLKRYLPYDPWSDEFNIAQIYIPGSYFINDLAEALEMSNYGDERAPLRALGVRPAQ